MALFTMAITLFAGALAGGMLAGIVILLLELLDIGNPETLEAFLAPAAIIGALIIGPSLYADRVREDAQPKLIDNLNEPVVAALMPLERLWQHRANLLGNLVTSNDALAKRLSGIDDDLARKVAAFLRERREELERERNITQQFIDAGKA